MVGRDSTHPFSRLPAEQRATPASFIHRVCVSTRFCLIVIRSLTRTNSASTYLLNYLNSIGSEVEISPARLSCRVMKIQMKRVSHPVHPLLPSRCHDTPGSSRNHWHTNLLPTILRANLCAWSSSQFHTWINVSHKRKNERKKNKKNYLLDIFSRRNETLMKLLDACNAAFIKVPLYQRKRVQGRKSCVYIRVQESRHGTNTVKPAFTFSIFLPYSTSTYHLYFLTSHFFQGSWFPIEKL